MSHQYQKSENGLLLTGLTRNTTSVTLRYPAQPNGKQASSRTSLQYADPEQLNAAQYQEAVLSGFAQQQPANPQGGYYNGPNPYTREEAYDGSGNAQGQQNQYTSSNETQGQVAQTTEPSTGGANDPQGQQGATETPARGQQTSRFWYCCYCGQGPYNDVTYYDTCVAGCHRVKCSSCIIEVIQSK